MAADRLPDPACLCADNGPHTSHSYFIGGRFLNCPGRPSAAVSPAEPPERRTYVVKVYFGATPEEFDALHDKVFSAVTDALGCTDDEHECPHFQVATAGPRRYEGRRFWALRCALRGLWEAVRYGEV